MSGIHSSSIGKRAAELTLDSLESDATGIIRIVGWTLGEPAAETFPRVSLDHVPVPLLQSYRVPRPDVPQNSITAAEFPPGIVFEYLVPPEAAGQPFSALSVFHGEALLHRSSGPFTFQPNIHYGELLYSTETFHRDRIYGSGPPNPSAQPESVALARNLPGPVLDFGCGSGALIKELRLLGMEAYGIELDNHVIRPSLKPEVASFITLYDGQLPTSFPTGRFRSVFCSEVLEHIPDYQSAAQEIARLSSERAIFTVPDAAAIPLGFRHGLVPWHLLESTHVNFFSQLSLHALLRPLFRKVSFGRVGASRINETSYHVSLVAYCWK